MILSKPEHIKIYGHRGTKGDLPENTLKSFKYLFENKISAFETDILVSKNLVPVINHDFRLNPALTKDSKGNWIENDDIKIFDLSFYQLRKFKIGSIDKKSKYGKRFDNQKNQLSHFNLSKQLDGFREWLFEQNIVYIGGGDTNYMLNLWSENNLKDIFKEAYEKGIILSGVSAGAVCWFEWILTDSLGDGYQPLKGVGLLEGSCTPHSSDLNRINEFENNIKNSKLPPGFAIDDGVAVLFIDGKPSDVYSARKNHNAYFVNKENKISLKEYIKNIE